VPNGAGAINMAFYRKKPVVIEAVKWDGTNLKEIINFIGLHESAKKWSWEEYEEVVKIQGLKIFTLEGPLVASIGDFIIKGIKGEFYPCKPDIFENTYELVKE
jgi:preprotein translocase subunit Sss1